MLAIVAAIALVFAIGVVMPTEATARAPRTAEKWGCTFAAEPFWSGEYLGEGLRWEAYGSIRHCDGPLTFIVKLSILQDIPGGPDLPYEQWQTRWRISPRSVDTLPVGGVCSPGGTPPTDPLYFRMKVERKGLPGVAWVASRNVANPCPDGTWPSPVAEEAGS